MGVGSDVVDDVSMQVEALALYWSEPAVGTCLGIGVDLGSRRDRHPEEDGHVVVGDLVDLEEQIEAAEFGQLTRKQPAFFAKLAVRGLEASFANVHPTARKPPLADRRLVGTLEQQDPTVRVGKQNVHADAGEDRDDPFVFFACEKHL